MRNIDSGGERPGFVLLRHAVEVEALSTVPLTHSLTTSLDGKKHYFVLNTTLKPKCSGCRSRTALHTVSVDIPRQTHMV